jgi:YidC/Oxa1 family membrane protein insertase
MRVPVVQQSDESNQRTMRAIILCVLVAVVYTQIFLAPQARQPQQPVAAPVSQQAAPAAADSAAVPAPPQVAAQVVANGSAPAAHIARSKVQSSPISYVQTENFQFGVSSLGARAVAVKLARYKAEHGKDEPLNLVNTPEGSAYPLGVYVGTQSDEAVVYALTAVNGIPVSAPSTNLLLAPDATAVLEYRGKLASGVGIIKRLTFTNGSYIVGVEVALDKPSSESEPVWLEWSHYYPKSAETSSATPQHLTYLDGFDKVKHVPIDELPEGVRDFGTSRWASIGDMYFMATLIPTTSGRNTMLGHEGELYVSRVAGAAGGGKFSLYAGPKDHKMLSKIEGLELERAIDLGWFSFLAFPLLQLLDFLFGIFQNYGMAIIGLTLVVKAVMLPLSRASFDSMRKMQELQPEIKALKERVKDPTQLNKEIFALYQRRGVNPMGGCFPVLIQIPVFLGLYQALLNAIDLRHARFGVWITDLSAPERLEVFGIGIPVMVLLMAASMILQQRTMPNTSTDPAQARMMQIMPFVFAGMFIIFPMPAGLVLYWLVNNLISITQQVYMRNTAKGSVYVATAVASVLILGAGYLVTLI